MKLPLQILSILVLTIAMPTEAARLTDVADAFDVYKVGDEERIDAFDAYFDLDFSFKQSSGLISREAGARGQTSECRPGNPEGCLPVDELSFTESTSLLNVRGEFGIFRDLAMTLNVPIILSRRLSFDYADGITPQSSSIDNANASAGSTTSLFAHDLTATYKGVAPLELGLRFAGLNDERTPTGPSWLLALEWALPWTSTVYEPEVGKTQDLPVGDGIHRVRFSTALSKRVVNLGLVGIDKRIMRRGYLEPYVFLAYTLPVTAPEVAVEALQEKAGNPFGASASHSAEFFAGFEVVPVENLTTGEDFIIDVGMRTKFVSEGKNYTVITPALGELTYTSQFLDLGLHLGLHGHPIDYLRLAFQFDLGYRTEHYLTNENVGEDNTGNGQVQIDECSLSDPDQCDLLNPYFDQRVDQIGYRLLEHGRVTWAIGLTLALEL